MKERNLLLAVAALVIVIAAAFALSSPRGSRMGGGNEAVAVTETVEESGGRPKQASSRLCASNAGFQQLKTAAFREAIAVRGDPGSLDRLAATSVVRMEQPEVTSEDAESGLVTCTGRFVIELPPGAERGFGGQRRLAADVSYTARPGADGGQPVYELTGADQLVSTLAAFDIDSSLQQPEPAEVQTAEAIPPEEQLPVIIRREPPQERPAPKQTQERPSPPPARAERERGEREQPKARPAPPAPRPTQSEERPAARAERPTPAPARSAVRPSFNCGQAGTRSERLVCSSERLASKDREMARYYFRSLSDADARTRRELERTRNRFLRYRERCPNEACIADAYDGRMAEIRDIVAGIE